MKYEPIKGNTWSYGEVIPHDRDHKYLGPCPRCGNRTFNYGGGWRCLDVNCFCSYTNPTPNMGPSPEWWQDGTRVFMDGNSWCATHSDFIDLQASEAGFGDTPAEAVKNLKALNTPSNPQTR